MPDLKSELVRRGDQTTAIIKNLSNALRDLGGDDRDLLRLASDERLLYGEIARLLREEFVIHSVDYSYGWLMREIKRAKLSPVCSEIKSRDNLESSRCGVAELKVRLHRLDKTMKRDEIQEIIEEGRGRIRFANVFELVRFYSRFSECIGCRKVVAMGTCLQSKNKESGDVECHYPFLDYWQLFSDNCHQWRCGINIKSADSLFTAETWLLLAEEHRVQL